MKAELFHEHGVAKIRINGETVSSVSFRSFWPQPGITKAFADGGIRLMNVYPSGILCSLDVPYSQFGEFWLGDGKYDWDVLRAQMDQFIENAPDNYFSLMLQLDTRDWFLKEHPECRDSFEHLPEAESFKPWHETAKRCIRDTLAFLDREYPEKIYCVYVAAGGTCEWYNRRRLDGDPVKEAAFREYTGDPDRRLPSAEEFAGGEYGLLLGEKDRNLRDYWRFLTDMTADTIKEYAREVKKYNPGLLVGCFSGYALAHESSYNDSCQSGLIRRIFDCPDIDLFFSPASYRLRGLESVSNSHVPMASVHLHGKMYYHEIDNTAYPANGNPYAQVLQLYAHRRHNSLMESVMYARRESAAAFAALGTYWWFDMFGGWYDDEILQKELLSIGRAQDRLYGGDVASNAEIAYCLDDESAMNTARHTVLREVFGQNYIEQVGRIGCQVDYYEAGDLTAPGFNSRQYKLYIFPDMVSPGEKVRRAVAKLRAEGASVIFCYAPGVLRDGKLSEEAMKELTGIDLKLTDTKFGYTLADKSIYNEDATGRVFGGQMDGMGVFVEADEPDENIFGRGLVSKKAQFAVKERGNGGFDAWFAQGQIPAFILRPLAGKASCHIWTKENLPVYTNSRMFAMFDHEGGERTIDLPWKHCRLEEMYTGETHIITNEDTLTLHFEKDECKCFIRLEENEE